VVPVTTAGVARERPAAARLAVCGVGGVRPGALFGAGGGGEQAASNTAAKAHPVADKHHVLSLTALTIGDKAGPSPLRRTGHAGDRPHDSTGSALTARSRPASRFTAVRGALP